MVIFLSLWALCDTSVRPSPCHSVVISASFVSLGANWVGPFNDTVQQAKLPCEHLLAYQLWALCAILSNQIQLWALCVTLWALCATFSLVLLFSAWVRISCVTLAVLIVGVQNTFCFRCVCTGLAYDDMSLAGLIFGVH